MSPRPTRAQLETRIAEVEAACLQRNRERNAAAEKMVEAQRALGHCDSSLRTALAEIETLRAAVKLRDEQLSDLDRRLADEQRALRDTAARVDAECARRHRNSAADGRRISDLQARVDALRTELAEIVVDYRDLADRVAVDDDIQRWPSPPDTGDAP